VIGGGVAGLAVAHDLARRRARRALEAADELGGLLRAVGSRASTSTSAPSPSRRAPMPWRDSSPMPGCRSISYGRAGWRGARPRGPLRRRRRHPRPLPRRTVLGIPPIRSPPTSSPSSERRPRHAPRGNATAPFGGHDARTVAVRPRRRAARSRRRRAARRHAVPQRLLARGARARLSELHPGLWAAFCATAPDGCRGAARGRGSAGSAVGGIAGGMWQLPLRARARRADARRRPPHGRRCSSDHGRAGAFVVDTTAVRSTRGASSSRRAPCRRRPAPERARRRRCRRRRRRRPPRRRGRRPPRPPDLPVGSGVIVDAAVPSAAKALTQITAKWAWARAAAPAGRHLVRLSARDASPGRRCRISIPLQRSRGR
jgi:oxygen-dependent protoporphyrinogen oxidase